MADVMLDRRLLTANLLALLISVTGCPGDVAKAPEPLTDPYFIVYPIEGGMVLQPALTNQRVVEPAMYQIDSVGLRDDQVDALAFRVRDAILGTTNGAFTHTLTPPTGMKIIARAARSNLGGLLRIDTVFQVAERFQITLTPA